MPSGKSKKTPKQFTYQSIYMAYNRNQFILDDYLHNPAMIKQLHEDKEIVHAYSSKLEEQLGSSLTNNQLLEVRKKELDVKLEEAEHTIANLRNELDATYQKLSQSEQNFYQLSNVNHKNELELAKISEKLEAANRNSMIQFALSTVSSLLIAFGVNLVTTTLNNWIGWMMIVIGILMGAIAFFIARKENNEHN